MKMKWIRIPTMRTMITTTQVSVWPGGCPRGIGGLSGQLTEGVLGAFAGLEDGDVEPFDPHKYDPEYFDYECYTVDEVKKLLNDAVEKVSDLLQLSPSLAKILLHENEWCVDSIVNKYRDNAVNLLVSVPCP